MTPREQLIQELFQAPDWLIDVLLKLVRLGQSSNANSVQDFQQTINQVLTQTTTKQAQSNVPVSVSAYDLAKDLAGCVEGGPTDLATNPKYMEGFGT